MQDLYQSQRAMRAMREAAMQRGVIAVLDIGSSKIACFVLELTDIDPERNMAGVGRMAGHGRFRVIGAHSTMSRGVRFGEIETMLETEKAIRLVVQQAQKGANMRVDHVIACFSGGAPRSYGLEGGISLGNEAISDGDVAHLLASCDVPNYGADREVLHAQPVNFILDGRSGMADPRGHLGRHLGCDMHMLTVDAAPVANIIRSVQRCNLELAGITSASYMSGLSALLEDDQKLGAACIDLGGGTTSVSLFLNQHMIAGNSIDMGGAQITSDIAMGLQISISQAENLKTRHGGLIATGADDRDIINLGGNTGDWEHDRRSITRSELIGIIRPRMEEILEEARNSLDRARFDDMPSHAIVLTGGASQLPGLDQVAARILGRPVRISRPLRIAGLPQEYTLPGYAATVGLALFAANPQDEWWDFDLTAERYPARSFRRVARWLKDNW